MSSKVNILSILGGHLNTLSNVDGSWSWADVFTFIVVPVAFAIAGVGVGFNLNKDVSSLLVNFGAIFTALLLSVLVLVYDQESKLDDKEVLYKERKMAGDSLYGAKKKFLEQLYFNISYSIISSLVLIGVCFFHSVIDGFSNAGMQNENSGALMVAKYVLTPAAVIVSLNLMLTIMMIVKRLHSLLTLR